MARAKKVLEDAGYETTETGESGPLDPIIVGLLQRLPPAGSPWPEANRELWLQLLRDSFKLIYTDQAAPSA